MLRWPLFRLRWLDGLQWTGFAASEREVAALNRDLARRFFTELPEIVTFDDLLLDAVGGDFNGRDIEQHVQAHVAVLRSVWLNHDILPAGLPGPRTL